MRRRSWVILAVVVLVLVVAVSAVASSGGDDDGAYRVRVIFDNASFVIPGENVKIGGVIVGKVDEVDLNAQNKAVVVLTITNAGFRNFRTDATCHVGLQSLIGEQYIVCEPTQKRADGAPVPPLIQPIKHGPGKGQHLVPVSRTSSPVGPDLINNIMRVPQRQRFGLILGELGVGLAGNGAKLREVIQRADPTLRATNEFVKILADQNKTLERLAIDSDRALAPLAQRTGDLKAFIKNAGATAEATAERGDDLERNFQRFPAFLRQLKPATQRISDLADQLGPSIANLSARAPELNTMVTKFGPFSKAATGAMTSLGDAADQGTKTFPQIQTLVGQVQKLATPLAPLSHNLADLATSFDRTGGITNLLQLIYYYTGSLNGKDTTSHYMRSSAHATNCIDRNTDPKGLGGCYGFFDHSITGASKGSSASSRATSATGAAASRARSATKAKAAKRTTSTTTTTQAVRDRLAALLGPGGTR